MAVKFIEEGHKYVHSSGEYYTSTTTIIGKYKEPFDSQYWSLYKAIERFVIETNGADVWDHYKRKVGYKNVIPIYKKKAKEDNKAIINLYQQKILSEWEYEKNIACFNGSNFHAAKEKGWLEKTDHYDGVRYKNWHKLGIQDMGDTNVNPKDLPDGVYSELILWNNQYKAAGAADIVYIETVDGVRYIDIDDYKTNKKIEEQSYYNKHTRCHKMMLAPLANVMDCNRCHYELQISTYAYYLECFGFVPRYLNFQHYNNVGTKEEPKYKFNKNYELEYKKEEVVKMLKHFNKKYNG